MYNIFPAILFWWLFTGNLCVFAVNFGAKLLHNMKIILKMDIKIGVFFIHSLKNKWTFEHLPDMWNKQDKKFHWIQLTGHRAGFLASSFQFAPSQACTGGILTSNTTLRIIHMVAAMHIVLVMWWSRSGMTWPNHIIFHVVTIQFHSVIMTQSL